MSDISNVWLCFDASGYNISGAFSEEYSDLKSDLDPKYFDVSSCFVIKNPEGFYPKCHPFYDISNDKIVISEWTKEKYDAKIERNKKRFEKK